MFKPKYRTLLGNFPKFRSKNSKFSVLSENWHSWYLKDADSFSNISFPNVQTKNSFLSKFGPKSESCQFCLKVGTHGISRKLIVIRTLVFWISNQKSILGKFGPKKSKLSAFSEYWHTWYLDDADSYFNICSLNFKPKTDFWPNLGQKSKFVHFVWKLAHMVSKGCGFLFRN